MTWIPDLALSVNAKYKKPFLIYGETPMVTDNALEDLR